MGQTGKHCEINSLCESDFNPCKNNGRCKTEVKNGLPSYGCICGPDYQGINCETLIDKCGQIDCGEHGNCNIDNNHFVSCVCTDGYFGEFCTKNEESQVDDPTNKSKDSVSGMTVFLRIFWVTVGVGVVGVAINNLRRAEKRKSNALKGTGKNRKDQKGKHQSYNNKIQNNKSQSHKSQNKTSNKNHNNQ